MSSNETTKIEPTLIVTDSPPIAACDSAAEPETAKAASELKPEAKIEAFVGSPNEIAKEAPKEITKSEAPVIAAVAAEIPKVAAPKIELSTGDAPALPPARQIDPVSGFI